MLQNELLLFSNPKRISSPFLNKKVNSVYHYARYYRQLERKTRHCIYPQELYIPVKGGGNVTTVNNTFPCFYDF